MKRVLPALTACIALAAAAGPAAAQDTPPAHEPQAADAREFPSLRISGFGDVNFGRSSRREGPRNFVEGQLALHMTSRLSPRVTFFGEISFTPRADAGTGMPTATGFNAEVERMIVRFDRSDRLKVSFGRYHTPIFDDETCRLEPIQNPFGPALSPVSPAVSVKVVVALIRMPHRSSSLRAQD